MASGLAIFNSLPNEKAKSITSWTFSLLSISTHSPVFVLPEKTGPVSLSRCVCTCGKTRAIKQRWNDFKQNKLLRYMFLKAPFEYSLPFLPKISASKENEGDQITLSPQAQGALSDVLWGRLQCPSPIDKACFISRFSVLFFSWALNSTSQS